MRILWFANTPCGAREIIDKTAVNGGWLNSLENLMVEVNDIELHISFYWGTKLEPFKLNKTIYHPVLRDNAGSRVGRYFNRISQKNKDQKEVTRLLQIIKEVNPDLIHIHGTEDNFGLVQEFIDIPIVISIQGIISSISLKLFSGIPIATIQKYEGLLSKLLLTSAKEYKKRMALNAFRERKILSFASNIIGRTDWDRRITRLLAPNSKYFVGQELMRPSFFELNWNKNVFGDPLKIVTILGNGIYKGLETIIKTSEILKNYMIADFEWIVIGVDEKSKSSKIVKRWLNVNFKSVNVKFQGEMTESKIAELLKTADIYCQMSHIENSPNSLCEAMLLGMPCIASFAGGTDTILTNREEGVLVQDGDPYSYAGAILFYKNDIEIARKYGQNARRKALIRHNKDEIKRTLLNTYSQVIK